MILRKLDRLFVRFRDKDDGAALAAVFDATSRELFEVACHLVRNPSDAEDLVQATFLTAMTKAKTYDGASPVQGWLYGILWNEAAKSRRTAARTLEPARLDPRSQASPEEIAQREEIPQSVAEALVRLPAHYREVLEPVIRSEESADSLARRLGRSPGTVRSQIHRGLERLRRELPPGLAPLPSLLFAVRGLPELRNTVLRSAGFPATAAGSASTAALPVTIVRALLSKSVLLGAGAASVVIAGGWFAMVHVQDRGNHEETVLAASAGRVGSSTTARDDVASVKDIDAIPHLSHRKLETATDGQADPRTSVDYWLARFNEAPDDWRHGLAVAYEVAKLAPDDALHVMSEVWTHLSVPVKEQVMKPFVFDGGHVHVLKILDLAAKDPTLSVQGRAFAYLASYAFQDFSTDYESYLQWSRQYRDLPVRDVVTTNARKMISDLLALPRQELRRRMKTLHAIHVERFGTNSNLGLKGLDLAMVLREAGGLRVLEACLQDDDSEMQEIASEWSKWMEADESWLQTWMLPRIEESEHHDRAGIGAAITAVSRPGGTWARKPLLEYIEHADESQIGYVYDAASGLAEIGDLSVIPELIGILLRDPTGKFDYAIGYYGLAKLTGVHWQKGYDGAWWLDWWEKNKMRFPPGVRDAVIHR